MKTKYIKYYATIPVLSILLLFANCSNNKSAKNVAAKRAINNPLKTFRLEKKPIDAQLILPAELTGFRQVDLFAKVSSFVKYLKVDIGANVKAGQLLIELEAPEMSAQLAAAASKLHSQEAVYTASNSTYQRLLETSKVEGTISKNDLELALSKKNSDYAQLQASTAAYQEIKVMQNYLQIRAPFSGKITARNVNLGAYVSPSGQTPLLTLQDNQKLRLSVSVPEAYSGYIKIGDDLHFRIASLKSALYTSKITRMAGALDTRLRAQKVEMDINNTTGELIPGMIAEVTIPLKSRTNPFVVPNESVITTSEGSFVIKLINNKTKRIKIELGLEANNSVEIFSNLLEVNDVLLARGNEEVKDGTLIN